MLCALNHGQTVLQILRERELARMSSHARTSECAPSTAVTMSATSNVALLRTAALPDRFGYMFGSGGIPETPGAFDKFGAIGTAMTTGHDLPGPSGLPAILTYFGQFVDHDITANTDRDPAQLPKFSISTPQLTLNTRDDVRAQLGNLRRGTLRLDSVYGDGGEIDAKLREGALMRIGATTDGAANDVPRFGAMLDAGVVTRVPDISHMNSDFGPVDARKLAFIGDGRNDENLVVAQLHLAFLRFHNEIAAALTGSNDERFAKAKKLVQWHYQWLVVERYLRAICDQAMLDRVMREDAGRYGRFAAAHGGVNDDHAPLPLEFSVAAFRFGHSMIRENYAFNPTFNPATLRQLFEFTGRGGLGGANTLPDIWIIDWANFLVDGPPSIAAMPLDPVLAGQLGDMPNEDRPHLRSLAHRNLRRSYVLNLPTAQTVAAALANEGVDVDFLATTELIDSPGGAALEAAGFVTLTPLWFYILAEAAKRGGGRRLGPLGSLIVAETLLGLIVSDNGSYWHERGPDGERWAPRDAALARTVDSFESLLSFAGVL